MARKTKIAKAIGKVYNKGSKEYSAEQVAAYKAKRSELTRIIDQIEAINKEEQAEIVASEDDLIIQTVRGHYLSVFNTLFCGAQPVIVETEQDGAISCVQMAERATMIGTMRQWRWSGRRVVKGSKAVYIYRPRNVEMEDDKGERYFVHKGFKVYAYFDISQTTEMSDERKAELLGYALAKEMGITAKPAKQEKETVE